MLMRLLIVAALAAVLGAPAARAQSQAERDRWAADCAQLGGRMNWDTGVCEGANTSNPPVVDDESHHCRADCRAEVRRYRAWQETSRGNAALRRNQFDKARRHYRSALGHVPDYSYALSNLSLVDQNETAVLYNQSLEAFDRGDSRRARTLLRQAEQVSPGHGDVISQLERVNHWDRFRRAASGSREAIVGILRQQALSRFVFMTFPRSLGLPARVTLVRQIHAAQRREIERILDNIRRSFEEPESAATLRRLYALADADAIETLRRAVIAENRAALEQATNSINRYPESAGLEFECAAACYQAVTVAQGINAFE